MKKRELAGSYEDFTPEPLLMENPNRFVLFPIEHADVCACVLPPRHRCAN
jgi:hypothetical protein